MNGPIPYLLKTVLCAALLYGYYLLALRNRLFHQWNRFYLLLILPLSLLLPLARIEVAAPAEAAPELPLRLLQVVTDGNAFIDTAQPSAAGFDPMLAGYCIYTVVALATLLLVARGCYRIFRLAKQYPAQRIGDIDFIVAPVPGTPFSFFRRIFWNPEIDPASDSGQQILEHELVHVRERHSLDKLLVSTMCALCWFNPVFWMLRKELNLVHEFIADKKSVRNGDASILAALILQSAYPQQYGMLANSFFHRAIKRRLYMLNQLQKARVQYFGRLAALPLLAVIGFAFAVRAQSGRISTVAVSADSEKFTVVIDAGHGRMANGGWNGASSHGVSEDEIVLELAQRIKALNADPNLDIVLTRPDAPIVELKERTSIASRVGARLFLSLHVDQYVVSNGPRKEAPKGFSIYVPADSGARVGSRLFGSALQQSLARVYTTSPRLLTRNTGVWVLKNSPCPAALIELGYIDKDADRAFLTDAQNRDRIARELLNAIQRYRLGNSTKVKAPMEVLPSTDPRPVTPATSIETPAPAAAADAVQPVKINADGTVGKIAPSSQNPTKAQPAIAGTLIILNGKRYESISLLIEDVLNRYPQASVSGKKKINLLTNAHIVEGEGLRNQYGGRFSRVMEITASDADIAGFAALFWEQVKADEAKAQPVALHSGDTLTVEQLRLIPLKSLLSPEGFNVQSCRLSGDLKNGDIVEFVMRDGVINESMKSIMYSAWSGQTLTVDTRQVMGPNGEQKKLPALVYFIR